MSGKEVSQMFGRGLDRDEPVEIEGEDNEAVIGVPELVSFDTTSVSFDTDVPESSSHVPVSKRSNFGIDRPTVSFDIYYVSFDTHEGKSSNIVDASIDKQHQRLVSIDTPPASIDTPIPDKTKSSIIIAATIDTQKLASIDTQLAAIDTDLETTIQPVSTSERVYKPPVPYPKPRKSKKEIEDAKYQAMLDRLIIEIPFVDTIKDSPVFRKYIKRLVANDVSPEEGALLTRDVSALLITKMPAKLPDPGSFVLDCSISTGRFERSLCDLGSGVNLMPCSVAKTLGLTDLSPTPVKLALADRSVRIPDGVLEDVPVRVGDCWVPVDFVVLDYAHNEPKDPIILGRPFLATAGACIDCRHGKITLSVNDKTVVFKMDRDVKRATIDGQTFMVEPLEGTVETEPKRPIGSDRGKDIERLVQPELTMDSVALSTAVQQNLPDITPISSPPKQRYAPPNLNSSVHAGRLPEPGIHPRPVPRFLGRSHAHNVYTPPWMRRSMQKHSRHASKPPDI